MMSIAGFVTVLALLVQTPVLSPGEQQFVDASLADRHLDAVARVSQTFDAAPVKDVLTAIGRATGLVVRFDQTVPEQEKLFTGELTDLSLDAALAEVLTANAMAFKVIAPKSVFIYSDTSANRQRFAESTRVFELAKADSATLVQALTQHLRTARPDGVMPRLMAVKTPVLIYVRATADKMDEIAAFIVANDKR